MSHNAFHVCSSCATHTVDRMAVLPEMAGVVCAECFRAVAGRHALPSSATQGYLLPVHLGCYFPSPRRPRGPRPNWIDEEEEQNQTRPAARPPRPNWEPPEEEQGQTRPAMRPPRPNEMVADAGCGTGGGYPFIAPRPRGRNTAAARAGCARGSLGTGPAPGGGSRPRGSRGGRRPRAPADSGVPAR